MGLGGYLAARSEAEHYASGFKREQQEIAQVPERERGEVTELFRSHGLTQAQAAPVVQALSEHLRAWIYFTMRYELGLEKPDLKRALTCGLDNCRGIHRWRCNSAQSIRCPVASPTGLVMVGGSNTRGVIGVRLHQRPFHREEPLAERAPNGVGRQTGGRDGFWDCAGDLLKSSKRMGKSQA